MKMWGSLLTAQHLFVFGRTVTSGIPMKILGLIDRTIPLAEPWNILTTVRGIFSGLVDMEVDVSVTVSCVHRYHFKYIINQTAGFRIFSKANCLFSVWRDSGVSLKGWISRLPEQPCWLLYSIPSHSSEGFIYLKKNIWIPTSVSVLYSELTMYHVTGKC